jgi:sugar-specific transcriptional regulator TrmB
MKKSDDLTTLLREMELSELEVRIYIWLLQNKRSTGYKIAMEIGKPVANTYKALKSLQKKGAVIIDNSTKKAIFDTVPVEEFLNKIENEFTRKKKKIIDEVQKLEVQQEKKGIYELQSLELMYEKATNMIKSAESSLLIDGHPAPLNMLKEEILNKKKDNITFLLKNYDNTIFEGIKQITNPKTDIHLGGLQAQWIVLIKDVNEALMAFFDLSGQEMKHCIWIRDPYISLILFNGSILEFNLTEIYKEVYGKSANKIENIKKLNLNYEPIFKLFVEAEKNVFRGIEK